MCLTMTQVESSFVLVPDASRGSLGSNDLVENFCCTRELYLAREDICVRNNVECLRCLMTCVVVLFSGHGLLTGGSVGLTAPPHTCRTLTRPHGKRNGHGWAFITSPPLPRRTSKLTCARTAEDPWMLSCASLTLRAPFSSCSEPVSPFSPWVPMRPDPRCSQPLPSRLGLIEQTARWLSSSCPVHGMSIVTCGHR
jgi:hypothetical protein